MLGGYLLRRLRLGLMIKGCLAGEVRCGRGISGLGVV